MGSIVRYGSRKKRKSPPPYEVFKRVPLLQKILSKYLDEEQIKEFEKFSYQVNLSFITQNFKMAHSVLKSLQVKNQDSSEMIPYAQNHLLISKP